MKRIFTLLVILSVITLTATAQNYGATLKFRQLDGRKISVSIDGRDFQQVGRIITINNIRQGMHRVKIYNNKGNFRTLVYSGKINTRANYIYRCSLEPYRGLDIKEFCCTNNQGQISQNGYGNNDFNNSGYFDNDPDWNDNSWDGHIHQGWNGNQYGNNNGNNGNNNGWGGTINDNNNNNNNGWNGNNSNNNNNSGNNNGYNNNNNGGWNNNNNNDYWGQPNQCMGSSNFEAFKQTVNRSAFDSGKMDIIRAQMKNAWISSSQLRDLVNLFSFESSKLDMAKFGAVHVVDRQNLFSIYDAFTFESSKSEFAKVIENLR
jgi:Domain of unknown function (DUF4476)